MQQLDERSSFQVKLVCAKSGKVKSDKQHSRIVFMDFLLLRLKTERQF